MRHWGGGANRGKTPNKRPLKKCTSMHNRHTALGECSSKNTLNKKFKKIFKSHEKLAEDCQKRVENLLFFFAFFFFACFLLRLNPSGSLALFCPHLWGGKTLKVDSRIPGCQPAAHLEVNGRSNVTLLASPRLKRHSVGLLAIPLGQIWVQQGVETESVPTLQSFGFGFGSFGARPIASSVSAGAVILRAVHIDLCCRQGIS